MIIFLLIFFSFSTLEFQLKNGILTISSGGELGEGAISSKYEIKLIKKVTFETNSDTKIQSLAFYNCIYLESCNLSKDITFISSDAFRYCFSLVEITIDAENQYFTVDKNILYNKDMTTIIKVPVNMTQIDIPTSVTTIQSHSFHFVRKMSRLYIPKNVEAIDSGSFFDSTIDVIEFEKNSSLTELSSNSFSYCNIQQIILSNTLTNIGPYAFDQNQKLFNITFLTPRSNNLTISSNAISNTVIESFTIPNNTILEAHALDPSNSLTTVEISENVELKENCFAGCPNIIKFDLRSSSNIFIENELIQNGKLLYATKNIGNSYNIPGDTTISNPLFQYYQNLTKLTNAQNNTNYVIIDSVIYNSTRNQVIGAAGGLENITLIDSVKVLGDYCFTCMSKLKTLTIKSDIDSINEKAFYRCSIGELHFKHVGTIGISAFEGCNAVTITFESSPEIISSNAFKQCNILEITLRETNSIESESFISSDLTKVTFEDSCIVPTIGDSAFENCYRLKTVTFHPKLAGLGESAFFNCMSLEEISFSSDITSLSIGSKCFSRCNFSTFTIDSKFSNISSFAFSGCSNLREVKFYSIPPSVGTCIFSSCNNLIKINLLNINDITNRKEQFNTIISDIRSNIKEIYSNLKIYPKSLFSNFISVETISIGAKEISESLFENCTNLKIVKFSGANTGDNNHNFNVRKRAFYNCQNLDYHFLKEVKYVNEYGFYGCQFPKSIVLPSSITSILSHAFSSTGIKTVNYCSTGLVCVEDSFDSNVKAFVTDSFENPSFCSLPTTIIDKSICYIPYISKKYNEIVLRLRKYRNHRIVSSFVACNIIK